MEGLAVSELASITCADSGSSVTPLNATQGSNPGGRSWGTGFSESSFLASLGRGMLDDSSRCHYFAGVKISCVAIFECSSTKFFYFTGNVTFLMCSTVENVSLKTI